MVKRTHVRARLTTTPSVLARRAPDSNRNRLASVALVVNHASRLGISPSAAVEHGTTLVFYSSDLDEVLSMADRVLVVRLGAVGDVVRTLPAVSALRAAYAGASPRCPAGS